MAGAKAVAARRGGVGHDPVRGSAVAAAAASRERGRMACPPRRPAARGARTVLGIDDLVPPRWDLNVQPKGTIRREGYRIEKLTFESYPGMAVPALLYVPEGIRGRAPGIVSIGGSCVCHRQGHRAPAAAQREPGAARLRRARVRLHRHGRAQHRPGPLPRQALRRAGTTTASDRSPSRGGRPRAWRCSTASGRWTCWRAGPRSIRERLGFTGESGGIQQHVLGRRRRPAGQAGGAGQLGDHVRLLDPQRSQLGLAPASARHPPHRGHRHAARPARPRPAAGHQQPPRDR